MRRILNREPVRAAFATAFTAFACVVMVVVVLPSLMSSLGLGSSWLTSTLFVVVIIVGLTAFALWIWYVAVALRQRGPNSLWVLLSTPFALAMPLLAFVVWALNDFYN